MTITKTELKTTVESERPKQAVIQDKSSLFELKLESLPVSVQAPVRHQHVISVQQYYTGDA
jgi:hypothetical protein